MRNGERGTENEMPRLRALWTFHSSFSVPRSPFFIRMVTRLKDKRCLIVGGTSGLGLAAAARFLQEGARVVIAGRSADKGAEAINHLRGKGPVAFAACDAAEPEQVQRMFGEALAFLTGLDGLYHVAGISGRRYGDGPLHECTDEGWQATLDANLKSTFLTNRAAVRHFLK